MRIAICDDDSHWRHQILEYTNAYAAANPERGISFTAYEWGSELMDAARKTGGFDVYILDILMHGMNGIELGTRLRQMGFDGKIIYLTSSPEYAIESYRVKAFNYLLKPIRKDLFFAALDDAYSSLAQRKGKGIIVRTKDSSIRVNFDSIEYAELCKRTVTTSPGARLWKVSPSAPPFPMRYRICYWTAALFSAAPVWWLTCIILPWWKRTVCCSEIRERYICPGRPAATSALFGTISISMRRSTYEHHASGYFHHVGLLLQLADLLISV